MKTLKEFLNEASWSRDVEQMRLVSPDEESQKLDTVPPPAKPPKKGKRVLLAPRKNLRNIPHGKRVIGWKEK